MNFFVIVPVFNEDKKIVNVVKEIKKYAKNIIVVNDGSTDRSGEVIRKINNIVLIDYPDNKGKGYALRVGAEKAWSLGAEAVVFIDGDGQHDPKLIKLFEKYLKRGEQIVLGVRVNKLKMSLLRKIGNWMIRFLVAIFYGQTIEDMICGYRAISRKVYKKIIWTSLRYGVETEMICNIFKLKLVYKKVRVKTIYTDKVNLKTGSFAPKDGLRILLSIPRWRFK